MDQISSHVAWCRASGYSVRTVTEREATLRRFDGWLPAGLAVATTVELTLVLGNAEWLPATRETYFSHLGGFFRQAFQDELIEHDPMARMKRPKVPKGEPRPVARAVMMEILERSINPFRLCAVLALGAGLRCMEVAALRREDITQSEIYLRTAKGGKSARMGCAPEIWEVVRDLPHGLIIEHVGGVADAGWISRRCADYWHRRLKLGGATMHRIRHLFAHRLRAAGADPWAVKRAMRHSSIRSTEIYLGASEEQAAQIVRGLPPFLAPYQAPSPRITATVEPPSGNANPLFLPPAFGCAA